MVMIKTLLPFALFAFATTTVQSRQLKMPGAAPIAARGNNDTSATGDSAPAGCNVDNTWCVFIDGDRSQYDLVEGTHDKEIPWKNGQTVFQYSTGTSDAIHLNSNGATMMWFLSTLVSGINATPWTKGQHLTGSWGSFNRDLATSANGVDQTGANAALYNYNIMSGNIYISIF
ncbi:hypothetical protein CF327_g578 [Tilletia walkeri]|uniref:Uncharacterized protein n=2 Tax=Tilletia TaxID=13289 RepID=A0A8X7N5K5_9BASI|nr:hypothetical protein CF327_g578 [Tilletia walkeri]KAE8234709.1 hypothetical protein CF326_g247 [Tilletia indica]KAE8235933.1 hypothetical protein A4X13_0g9326 [Tilletia indica]KAE8266070.1 hypothetical protein A4X09_0g6268 [Tilletia walkeri]